MDSWFEVIAALVGIIAYWVMSAKDSNQQRKNVPKEATPPVIKRAEPAPAPKAEAPAPTPPPAPAPSPSPRRAAAPPPKKAPEPVTFEQLLEQFSPPKKPISRAEREEKFGTDDDFEAAQKKRLQRWEALSEMYRDPNQSIVKKDGSSSLLKEPSAPVVEPPSFIKLLQDHKSLHNAIIIKEILDRKHF